MREKRRHPRLETPPHVAAYQQIAVRGHGDLCDISRSGMRLKTMDRSELGAISLLFKLPPGGGRPIAEKGRVVWIRNVPGSGFEVGIAFNGVSEATSKAIEDFYLFKGQGVAISQLERLGQRL